MRTYLLLSLSLVGLSLACQAGSESPTAPDPSPALAGTASALVFTQVSAGNAHTCGLTLDNQAYCWGANRNGQLGDGTTTDRLVPVLVAGGFHFRQISAGDHSTCAITTASSVTGGNTFAMCWGLGPLGGFAFASRFPVFVKTGLQFRRVEVGDQHACAVTPEDPAYCWGDNIWGQLGGGDRVGSTPGPVPSSPTPIPVIGGHKFRHVAAGAHHTCGVTTENAVFCWGLNQYGAVGDSSTSGLRTAPTQVAGRRQYHQVDAGRDYSCAVTLAGRAFCWEPASWASSGTASQRTRATQGRCPAASTSAASARATSMPVLRPARGTGPTVGVSTPPENSATARRRTAWFRCA